MALIFYKILLDPSAPHLELPPDFVTKNKIPTGPIILCANGGYSWRLKIKQIGDGYCFADGWNNVVEEVPLDFGDFLYFRLVDQSHFKMSLYSPEGCEMFLPPKVENEDNEEEKDDDDDPFFTLVITKTNMNILRFPREFVGLAGIDDAEETMTLKNVDGKEWLSCLRFIGLAGIDVDEGTMTVKNVDGKEWVLGLRVDKWYNYKSVTKHTQTKQQQSRRFTRVSFFFIQLRFIQSI
ncbi:hypothetical protein L1987_39315 [Smallanthus sonchifolius]|uniref:Uncharacterized protein n=1 Tax=Smallanthus sonchifolius TaxID=185202 RepID=A0ACB9HLZ6_9ASTR|nr:hypothetical protein L1987_39315 [Smallanthus sonchifolius]